MTQAPFTQLGEPPPAGAEQTVAHAPQWLASVASAASKPLLSLSSQLPKIVLEAGVTKEFVVCFSAFVGGAGVDPPSGALSPLGGALE